MKLQNEALIYKLFEKQGNKAQCNICSKVLSTLQGSTTTIRHHASRFHEAEWKEVQANEIISEEASEDSNLNPESSTKSHYISYVKTPNKLISVKLEAKNDLSSTTEAAENNVGEEIIPTDQQILESQ